MHPLALLCPATSTSTLTSQWETEDVEPGDSLFFLFVGHCGQVEDPQECARRGRAEDVPRLDFHSVTGILQCVLAHSLESARRSAWTFLSGRRYAENGMYQTILPVRCPLVFEHGPGLWWEGEASDLRQTS